MTKNPPRKLNGTSFCSKRLLKGCDQSHQVNTVFLLGQIIQTSSLSNYYRQTERSGVLLFVTTYENVTIKKHHNEFITLTINIYISLTFFFLMRIYKKMTAQCGGRGCNNLRQSINSGLNCLWSHYPGFGRLSETLPA